MSDWAYLNKCRFPGAPKDGFNGAFRVWSMAEREFLKVIASDGGGWQHVSVSRMDRPTKPPTWGQMCDVKEMFWEAEDVVCQYHPAKSHYVNCHPGCLHLWRPTAEKLPTPPDIMVGPKTVKWII